MIRLEERDKIDKYLRENISECRQQFGHLTSKKPKLELKNTEHKDHMDYIVNYLDKRVKQLDSCIVNLRHTRKKNEKEFSESGYLLKSKMPTIFIQEPPVIKNVIDLPHLNEEQLQQLSTENKQLQERLFKFDNQIDTIVQQVTDIQMLSEKMAQHVEFEAELMDTILETDEQSINHMNDAIKNLMDLKRSSKDLRLFVVTLLLFLSFSLLFLHWVNP